MWASRWLMVRRPQSRDGFKGRPSKSGSRAGLSSDFPAKEIQEWVAQLREKKKLGVMTAIWAFPQMQGVWQ